MKKLIAISILALSSLSALGEALLPIAPPSSSVFHKTDWTISAALFVAHLGDYTSTEQGVRQPRFRESVLPQALVHSHAGLAAYEFGTASLEVLCQYELTKHGHRRMARIAQIANIDFTTRTVAHNYEVEWRTILPARLRPSPR
jgi:hypothetical protein